jgi:hypothetical protein
MHFGLPDTELTKRCGIAEATVPLMDENAVQWATVGRRKHPMLRGIPATQQKVVDPPHV